MIEIYITRNDGGNEIHAIDVKWITRCFLSKNKSILTIYIHGENEPAYVINFSEAKYSAEEYYQRIKTLKNR